MKRNPMTTLATLEAMVAAKTPKERIEIYWAANPGAAVEDLFRNVFAKGRP